MSKLLLTKGYIREYERTVKLYGVIPSEIIDVIYEYTKLYDKWSYRYSSPNIKINTDKNTITAKNESVCTAFGDIIVPSGTKFIWRLFVSQEIQSAYKVRGGSQRAYMSLLKRITKKRS